MEDENPGAAGKKIRKTYWRLYNCAPGFSMQVVLWRSLNKELYHIATYIISCNSLVVEILWTKNFRQYAVQTAEVGTANFYGPLNAYPLFGVSSLLLAKNK